LGAKDEHAIGVPRIISILRPKAFRVGRKRVARLMSAAGLAGVSRRKFVHTTVKGSGRQAPDLVDRQFTAERPNLLWVADELAGKWTHQPAAR
jgi:putative transposase